MHAVATDIVKQWTQLVECHPASHDALAASEDFLVEVIPLGTSSLRLSHTGGPLYGIQLLYLKECIKMVHGPNAVKVIERVVYLLALLTDERLHEAPVVIHANHGRDVTLQLRHLPRSP